MPRLILRPMVTRPFTSEKWKVVKIHLLTDNHPTKEAANGTTFPGHYLSAVPYDMAVGLAPECLTCPFMPHQQTASAAER